jgi:hypothetical protein
MLARDYRDGRHVVPLRSLIVACLVAVTTLTTQAELPSQRIQISGRIADSEGQPIAGAIVTASVPPGGASRGTVAQTQSNADGNYSFAESDVVAGMHIKTYSPGYAMQSQAVPMDGQGNEGIVDFELVRPTTIRVRLYGTPWYFYRPAGTQQRIKFSLHETGKAVGRVIDKASGTGIANLRVQFAREQHVIETALTDANGQYEVELPDLDFQVSVTPSDQWNAGGARLTIKIEPSTTTRLKELSVSSNPPIKGQVVTADGVPVENAIVVVGFRDQTLLTDQQGRFSFQIRDQLRTFVQALHPYESLSTAVGVVAGVDELKIVLEPEGAIVGFVTDDGGKPLAGFPVELSAQFSFGRGGTSTTRASEQAPYFYSAKMADFTASLRRERFIRFVDTCVTNMRDEARGRRPRRLPSDRSLLVPAHPN